MKKFCGVFAVLLICAAIVLPAAAGTLDALSYRSAPHLVVHMEGVSKTLSRWGDSFIFEMLLDKNPMINNYYEPAGCAAIVEAYREFARLCDNGKVGEDWNAEDSINGLQEKFTYPDNPIVHAATGAYTLKAFDADFSEAPDVINVAAEKYVLLTIAGEKVNLRSQPRAGGKALKQCNTGDRFLAEPNVVTDSADGSAWYKIIAAVQDNKPYKYAAYVSARYANASAIPSGLVNDDSFLFTRLFNDFFLVYARREKPIVWDDVQNALTAAGYEVMFEEGTYSVDDPDNEDYWLGGDLTTDGEAVGEDKPSCAWLADIQYNIGVAYEKDGVMVDFRSSGDRYFINREEVGSLDDLINYLK